jgi:hypothetical protein
MAFILGWYVRLVRPMTSPVTSVYNVRLSTSSMTSRPIHPVIWRHVCLPTKTWHPKCHVTKVTTCLLSENQLHAPAAQYTPSPAHGMTENNLLMPRTELHPNQSLNWLGYVHVAGPDVTIEPSPETGTEAFRTLARVSDQLRQIQPLQHPMNMEVQLKLPPPLRKINRHLSEPTWCVLQRTTRSMQGSRNPKN